MSRPGDELIESMAQALAHAQGKRGGSRTHKIAIKADEIQKARKRLGFSQDQFAAAFGVSASTLRKWEQGAARSDRSGQDLVEGHRARAQSRGAGFEGGLSAPGNNRDDIIRSEIYGSPTDIGSDVKAGYNRV
jgi:putative transcriptional regulator